MALATRPDPDRPLPAGGGRGQGPHQARGTGRSSGRPNWPPRWLTPVPPKAAAAGDGPDVLDFVGTYGRITKDSIAGRTGLLLPVQSWQRELITQTFARENGRRRHRFALWGMARKNGKTGLVAPAAVYGLLIEGEGAEVYSCAADRAQAKLVFQAAKRTVELDPELSGLL